MRQYVFKNPVKRLLAGLFDFVGDSLRRIFLSKSPDQSRPIKKILLIRTDHLGDILMIRPVIELMARTLPEIQIDLLIPVMAAPLFETDPRIHSILQIKETWFSKSSLLSKLRTHWSLIAKLRSSNYDAAIDFRGDLRHLFLMAFAGIPQRISYGITGGGFLLTEEIFPDSKFHQVRQNQQLLNFLGLDEKELNNDPIVLLPEEIARYEVFWAKELPPGKLKVIIHSGAGYPSKRWPGAHFKSLVSQLLKDEKNRVLLVGSHDEKSSLSFEDLENPHLRDLRGRTSLRELAFLLSSADYFIGNDSGPAHLAAAQGIPGIFLMSGTNRPEIWKPFSDILSLIQHEVPCSPCESQICPLNHHDCMQKITPDAVWKRIQLNFPQMRRN